MLLLAIGIPMTQQVSRPLMLEQAAHLNVTERMTISPLGD